MIQNLENEVWLPIEGYEGLYEVSNMGRIKSLEKTRVVGHGTQIRVYPEIIKKTSNIKGYISVSLNGEHRTNNFLVHRLVAIAFISNSEGKKEVNHIGGDKNDNRASQLAWCTPSENMSHAHRTGLKSGLVGGDNGSAKLVLDTNTGIFYDCAKDAFKTTRY